MSGTPVRIADVVRVSSLGEGCQGTVWTARLRNAKPTSRKRKDVEAAPFALKQRLIKRVDAAMRSTRTSSALREIEFYRKVANRYPLHFSKLFDYEITEATVEVKKSFNTASQVCKSGAEGRSSLKQYTHLLTTLSARKEGVLSSIYHTLNRPQWLSMLAQVCYAIALIHERGFSHGDVWESNVAFENVPRDQDVQIYRTTVPSLGFVWSIIDYGSVELKADETEAEQRKKRASSYELDDMISLASGEDDAEAVCKTEGGDVMSAEFRRRVMQSLDGPSVRLGMKKTGLPLHQVLALINLDSYLWHLCGRTRTGDDVKAWIQRPALMQMAEMHATYSNLATYFARLARDAVKHSR